MTTLLSAATTSTKIVGKINIKSGAVVITDPMHEPDHSASKTLSAKDGEWIAEVGFNMKSEPASLLKIIRDTNVAIFAAEQKVRRAKDYYLSLNVKARETKEMTEEEKAHFDSLMPVLKAEQLNALKKARIYSANNFKGQVSYLRITHESIPKRPLDLNTMKQIRTPIGEGLCNEMGFCDRSEFLNLGMWKNDKKGWDSFLKVQDSVCERVRGAPTIYKAAVFEKNSVWSAAGYGDGANCCFLRRNEHGECIEIVLVSIFA